MDARKISKLDGASSWSRSISRTAPAKASTGCLSLMKAPQALILPGNWAYLQMGIQWLLTAINRQILKEFLQRETAPANLGRYQ